jgi:hypothetical protein
METRCHWRYTHPAWGLVITKEPFTEADARRLLADAERVDGSEVTAEHSGHIGWGFASGLVRREDGAMVQERWPPIERSGS